MSHPGGGNNNSIWWWERFQQNSREWRHDRCLMSPVSAILLLVFLVFSFVSLAFSMPALVLGFFLQPLLSRFSFVIEFLYPTALGRWLHVTLVTYVMRQKEKGAAEGRKSQDKNRGYHSRALEARVEVVKGRLYLHPLPQFLDNLGYLVVCLPKSKEGGSREPSSAVAATTTESTSLGTRITVTTEDNTAGDANRATAIVAFVVDCGQADSVLEQLALISEIHYGGQPIQIQSILSTHKHHDHTAGNTALVKSLLDGNGSGGKVLVFGGAVERVPECNYPLADGEMLPLPKRGHNDMNDLVEVEAVATPGHTRGSLAYVMRTKPLSCCYSSSPPSAADNDNDDVPEDEDAASSASVATTAGNVGCFLFTGDTLFSGGNGVPFEADVDPDQESKVNGMNPNSLIKASAGNYAMERCFAEIMARCAVRRDSNLGGSSSGAPAVPVPLSPDRVLLFPGHEYTADLLFRQMSMTAAESTKWKHFAPQYYFETCSQYYVAMHRRALPHSSGRLLAAPTSLRRELLVNPQLRMLRRRGELVIRAVRLWHEHFAKTKVEDGGSGHSSTAHSYSVAKTSRNGSRKGISSHSRWNLDAGDVDRPVFTTLYSSEVDDLIAQLEKQRIDAPEAARRLRNMKKSLQVPTIGRRPIPDSLPSDRAIFKTLLGFVLLGSSPSALTMSDSEKLKIPPPIVGSNSDRIVISKKRLLAVLYWLGLLSDNAGSSQQDNGGFIGDEGKILVAMIDQLWKETREYSDKLASFNPKPVENGASRVTTYDTVDVEVEIRQGSADEVDVGSLRWVIYGIPQKPPSWLAKVCMPCCSWASGGSEDEGENSVPSKEIPQEPHPANTSNMKKHSGELVRHDIYTCPLCRSAAGCPVADEVAAEIVDDERSDKLSALPPASSSSSSSSTSGRDHDAYNPARRQQRPVLQKQNTSTTTFDEDPSIELSQSYLNAMLREA